MITDEDYLSTHGRHGDRLEWVSPAVERNARILMRGVNALLLHAGFSRVRVSSGFRTIEANRKAKGAAYSRHLTGEAVDLVDTFGAIGKWVKANPHALTQFGLWAEDPDSTNTWVHLQCVAPPSGNRIFKP
jgi:hypothetical protein